MSSARSTPINETASPRAAPSDAHLVRPLTERILERLPGARVAWIVAWALIPWLNAGSNLLLGSDRASAIWEQSRTLVILNYAALSSGILIALWGTRRIARRLERLGAAARDPFRAMNDVRGPLLAAAATALVFGTEAAVRDGGGAGLLRGASWLVLGIAFWTYLWTYGSLQLGLYRLGRERLLDPRPTEPYLGFRPLGDAAFTGLWMLLAWLVPVLMTGLTDLAGVTLGLLVLTCALAAFFVSLFGLHRQMVAVKHGELAVARALYAEAYEPLRREQTLDVLEKQQSLLGAADALEKRAHGIHEWPIDEGTFARVVTIATSVVAMGVARLILDPFGL